MRPAQATPCHPGIRLSAQAANANRAVTRLTHPRRWTRSRPSAEAPPGQASSPPRRVGAGRNGGVETLRRIAIEDAERDGKAALRQIDQKLRDGAARFVMNEHARRLPIAAGDIDHIKSQVLAVEPQPLRALGEEHRLAMLDPDNFVGLRFLVGDCGEDAIVEHGAILIDLDEACPLVGARALQHGQQLLLRHVDDARHEPAAGAEREAGRVRRLLHRAERRRRRARALPARRRILAFCQPVNLVVEQEHLAIEVPPQEMRHVVAADGQPVAVAGDDPHVEVRIGELDARRHRWRPAVDRVVAIGFNVIGEAAGAADARDEHRVLRLGLNLRERALNGLDDRIIAAARAPAHFLGGSVVGGSQGAGGSGRGCGGRGHGHGGASQASACWIAASISAMRKGRPETLLKDLASTRYWSRSSVLSWPVFISGTRMRS